ncbi:MAG TPA: hypothetical protein DCQ06_01735, partial [Myxococcales bacterium]|nr:hypothetical protein [Myxococcales bacterium]
MQAKLQTMTGKPRRWFGLILPIALAACAVEDGPVPGGMSMSIKALSDSCGGDPNANPFTQISSYELVVRNGKGKTLKRLSASKSGSKLTIADVPAGSGLQLSLLGKSSGSTKWFARRSGQKIVKNTETTFDMTLMAVDAFTCISPNAGQIVNVLFPAVTPIAGGKVLITGGFTTSKTVGSKIELSQPSDETWIFDPNTGDLRRPQNNARMSKGRAGHSAIFLPKSNRVLIVGGTEKMTIDTSVGGPPTWRVSDGVGITYEVFDISTETFFTPETQQLDNAVKRVFPNLMPLSDDYVVALGGALWPAKANADQTIYMHANLYDPTEGDNGAFVSVGAALPLNTARAGASIAFLGTTNNGGSRYLVWGGDSESNPLHAEVFSESSIAGGGLFDAGYKVEGDITSIKGGLYFATLTALGKGKDGTESTEEFLSVGGIRHDGKNWAPPRKEDVYVGSVNEAK